MNGPESISRSRTIVAFLALLGVVWTAPVLHPGILSTADASATQLSIGEQFHRESSLTREQITGQLSQSRPAMPDRYKTYPNAKVTKLPKPSHRGMPVEDAIRQRRSIRSYSSQPITVAQLSELLFSAQGISGGSPEQRLRTAPSAGALYPFEIYLVANRVEGLSKGIYHYAVREHAIELVREGNFGDKIAEAGLGQDQLRDSAVTFVLCAIFDRTRSKYGERGFRYVYIEAGHIVQNLCLEAVSLGLGSVPVGAFVDKDVNAVVGVDGSKEAAIFMHAVGCLLGGARDRPLGLCAGRSAPGPLCGSRLVSGK